MNPGALVLDALARDQAGAVLLQVAETHDPAHVVGGAVRDHLLGRAPRELDVVVEGDALGLARELSERLSGGLVAHERFGTATIDSPAGTIDIAAARIETYPHPGALPEVKLGASLGDDILRRDFSVNTLAVSINGKSPGVLNAAPTALEDLEARRLSVLHDHSFTDDPTRLLRLARYAARLAFEPDEHTKQLALTAITGGALNTVSGPRIGADLRLALADGGLRRLDDDGVLSALRPTLAPDHALHERATALHYDDVRTDLLALATAALPEDREHSGLGPWLDNLAFPRRDRDAVLDAVARNAGAALAAQLQSATRASEIDGLLTGTAPETQALAAALGAEAQVRRWRDDLRDRDLAITGDDLIAAGVPKGPDVGRHLAQTRARLLDGELADDKQAQLDAALH